MNVDLSKYETVKERKARFYSDHPNGRIVVKLLNDDLMEKALFQATVYLNEQDQEKNLARSTGYALEVRDKTKSISNSGKEYESVNYSSWTENCEESAIGRALDNAGYSGNKMASRDEMEKAQRMSKSLSADETYDTLADPQKDELTTLCAVHNVPMTQGFAKATGNPYWSHKVDGKMCFGKGVK